MSHCSEILIVDKKSEIMVEAQEFAWRNADHEECGGSTVVTQNGTDSVEVIRVSKLVYSEKDVINLIEDMISSSMELKEFINNKWDYLNH